MSYGNTEETARFSFGKYEGELILATEDYGYLKWILANAKYLRGVERRAIEMKIKAIEYYAN